jgi:tripeptidyl-peptidase-2
MLQVFDANKRLLYTGDAVPDEVSLVKGEYSARLMLRHDNMGLLDKLKDTCMVRHRGAQHAKHTALRTWYKRC